MPIYPAMRKRLTELGTERFSDGIIKYTPTPGIDEARNAFLNILKAEGLGNKEYLNNSEADRLLRRQELEGKIQQAKFNTANERELAIKRDVLPGHPDYTTPSNASTLSIPKENKV